MLMRCLFPVFKSLGIDRPASQKYKFSKVNSLYLRPSQADLINCLPTLEMEMSIKMKHSTMFLLLLVVIMGSCSPKPGTVEGVVGTGYPDGAVVHAYEGLTGRVKVILYDGERIIGEGDYLNEQPDGAWTDYDKSSGQVVQVTNFLNGQRHGVALSFNNRNGQLETKATYNRGVLHGQSLTYQSRKIVEEQHYENGQLNGIAKKYYTNGTIKEEAPYVNGTLHGIATWYKESGELLFQYEYDNGNFVKDVTPASTEATESE